MFLTPQRLRVGKPNTGCRQHNDLWLITVSLFVAFASSCMLCCSIDFDWSAVDTMLTKESVERWCWE